MVKNELIPASYLKRSDLHITYTATLLLVYDVQACKIRLFLFAPHRT